MEDRTFEDLTTLLPPLLRSLEGLGFVSATSIHRTSARCCRRWGRRTTSCARRGSGWTTGRPSLRASPTASSAPSDAALEGYDATPQHRRGRGRHARRLSGARPAAAGAGGALPAGGRPAAGQPPLPQPGHARRRGADRARWPGQAIATTPAFSTSTTSPGRAAATPSTCPRPTIRTRRRRSSSPCMAARATAARSCGAGCATSAATARS